MARYDSSHDYGMRGYGPDSGARRYEPGRQPDGTLDRRRGPRGPRVTARYNRDYVFGGRGELANPTNYTPYGGDRPDQIADGRGYRRPYLTTGGTRTYRGVPEPIGYGGEYDDYDLDYHPFR